MTAIYRLQSITSENAKLWNATYHINWCKHFTRFQPHYRLISHHKPVKCYTLSLTWTTSLHLWFPSYGSQTHEITSN